MAVSILGEIPLHFAIHTTTLTGSLQTLASSTNATSDYLTQVRLQFRDAMNTKNVHPSNPLWRHIDSSFTLFAGKDAPRLNDDKLTEPGVQENLECVAKWCAMYIDSQLKCWNVRTDVTKGRG